MTKQDAMSLAWAIIQGAFKRGQLYPAKDLPFQKRRKGYWRKRKQ